MPRSKCRMPPSSPTQFGDDTALHFAGQVGAAQEADGELSDQFGDDPT